MIEFEYVAYDINNKKVVGKQYAENEKMLYEVLYEKGLFLYSLKNQNKFDDSIIILKPKVVAEFCRRMGNMLDSGLTISSAFEILQNTTLNKKSLKIFSKVYQDVQYGEALSKAMKKTLAFPDILINVILASEANGSMAETLLKMADYYDNSVKLTSKIRGALIYPIFVISISLIGIIALFSYILPKLLESMGELMELPPITQFMMSISSLFINYGPLLAISSIFFIVSLVAFFKTKIGKVFIGQIKLKIPFVKRLTSTIYTARFASTLSSMYSTGISIPEAVRLSASTTNNEYLSNQITLSMNKLFEGMRMSESLKNIEGLRPDLMSSIQIGEETGRLDSMLESLSKTLDNEANSAIDAMTKLLEPLSIVMIGVLLIPVVVAVILPMMSIYNVLGS